MDPPSAIPSASTTLEAAASRDDADAMPAEKKRRRPALSCEQCRKRKIRCDRNVPCTHCVKSNIAACSYAPTHTPKAKLKRPSEALPIRTQAVSPAHIQAAGPDFPNLPTPSSELIGPASWPAPVLGPSSSVPSSTAGSASEASHSNVDWLVSRIHQLEEKLSSAVEVSESRVSRESGPGEGVVEFKEDDRVTKGGIVSKTRYFGQSHWMNGAELFPVQLGMLSRAEYEKSELFSSFIKCKVLGRSIKQSRLKPLSSVNLGKGIPRRELANQLVENYLRTFEGVMRVVHVPSFRAEYERYWQNPDAASESFTIQLQLCMALGATLHDERFSLRSMAMQWVYEAQLWLMLPPEKSRMTTVGIQIMCLVNIAKSVCGAGHDLTWITTGALLRKAMYMGLHRDPMHLSKMTRYRAEMRRRLWATILELNMQSAFDAGGSALISSSDYDTRPPANLDDDQLGDEPDTENSSEQPADVPTQTSVQLALLRSHVLRMGLLKHVNDVQTPESYTETLRLNSELTKACLSMTKNLTALSKKSSAATNVTAFHISVAELLLYRCFHSLHQPVMVKSMEDPKYYFSRKMCLDSALKITHLCGLSGRGRPDATSTNNLPQGSDFRRLIINGTGVFRNVPVQSIFSIIVAVAHQRSEEAVSLGYLPSLGDADLRGCLDAAQGWMAERLHSGETNIKGCCFIAACVAHIDAVKAGLDTKAIEAANIQAALDASARCWESLKEMARNEGVPLDEADGTATGMEGVMTFEDAWMGDLAWDDSAQWAGLGQAPFDTMSPMFTGQFGML